MLTLDENFAAPLLKADDASVSSFSKTSARLRRTLKARETSADGAEDIRILTTAIRRGDTAAFARFHDLYSFRLYRFVLMLARGDANAAQEICQAALTKAAKKFVAFEDEGKLWAWLCVLAKNTFIDHYRAQQRRGHFVPLEEMPVSTAVLENSTNQLTDTLREALAALPAEERELMQAAYIDRRPLQELADASGLTYKAMESRLGRLRQKLKEQLLKNLRHENKS